MASKQPVTTGKMSVSGKRAFMVPVLICLLAIIFPFVSQTFVWLDFKVSDLLFTSLPFLNQISGQKDSSPPPVLIINKDQTFFQRFHRDPDRADMAALIKTLAASRVGIIALDFIYDSAVEAGKDTEFASALASFPLPLLATHFIGRGTQTFEKHDIIDSAANRPPWPVSLYRPFADNAAASALINIAADLDSTVRFAPLAFHPAEMEEFIPSLGFATWIATLIDSQAASISATVFSSGSDANAVADQTTANFLLASTIASGPFKFSSTGHAGIDNAARRLELQFVARFLGIKYPGYAEMLKIAAKKQETDRLPAATWLQMPAERLPLIGDYHMPCLRLPFKKTPPPFRGDGIETLSMGTLLQTDKDRASTLLDYRNLLDIEAGSERMKIRPGMPQTITGNSALSGRVVRAAGEAVSNAEALLTMPETGYWQLARTDQHGSFTLNNLPEGAFTLEITARSSNGWQRGNCRSVSRAGEKAVLPTLVLAENALQILIPGQNLPRSNAKVAIFGEPMPVLTSDNHGRLPIQALPEGFSISGFDEDQVFTLASGSLLNTAGTPVENQTLALLPDESFWTLRFYAEVSIASDAVNCMIQGLPSSIDARLAIFSANATATSQKTADLTLLPGEIQQLRELPPVSPMATEPITLSFDRSGPQPVNLLLTSETGKRYECRDDQTLAVEPGQYLVLSELNGARSMYRPSIINKRTVFVGSALPSDQDFVVTPVNFIDTGFPRMPGVNLHATLFSSLMQQSFMRAVPFHSDAAPRLWPLLQFGLTLPLLLFLNLVFIRAGAIWGGMSLITALAAWFGLGSLLFLRQILLPFFFPALLVSSFGVIRGYLAWAISRRQEQETRQTFGRFISSAVVEDILKMPGGLRPGGEKKELSVIFTDLAGFTSISEKLAPEQLTELMNEYLDEMTNILFSYGGTLDKYIGDAIMGFWNHPAPQADHAQRAVECAISMQHKLAELREKWLQQGLPKVEVRAGINSAVCMVGFIGSHIQMNFTCLGDGVNLASRLEGANKAYGTFMMISDSVHNQIDKKLISTRFLDFLAVKGKDRPVEVFEVRGYRRNEPEFWASAEASYNEGIRLYLSRSWAASIAAFSKVLELIPEDGPAKVYIGRCEEFKNSPPPENWDGRYILKSK